MYSIDWQLAADMMTAGAVLPVIRHAGTAGSVKAAATAEPHVLWKKGSKHCGAMRLDMLATALAVLLAWHGSTNTFPTTTQDS